MNRQLLSDKLPLQMFLPIPSFIQGFFNDLQLWKRKSSALFFVRYLGYGPRNAKSSLELIADKHESDADSYPPPLKPPNVEITGRPGSISIKLGESAAATHHTPEEQLHLLSPCLLGSGAPLKIFAELEIGAWSKYIGFHNLGQYLAILGKEVSFKQWEALTIRLPNNHDLRYDLKLYQIPEHALENLRHLDWSGHREQLAWSWLPFRPPLLQSLTTLIITCDVGLDDCSRLLLHGTQLKHFELHSIRDDGNAILYFLHNPAQVDPKDWKRPYLESLILTSYQDITSLLQPFEFPALRNICFDLWYPTQDLASLPINWTTLKRVALRCDITEEQSGLIQRKCGAGTDHEHIRRVKPRNIT